MSIDNPYKYDIFTIFANDDLIIKNKKTDQLLYEYSFNEEKVSLNIEDNANKPLVIEPVVTTLVKSIDVDKAIEENIKKVTIEKDIIIANLDKQYQEIK